MFETLKSLWSNRGKKIPDTETLRTNLSLIEDRLTKITDDFSDVRYAVEKLKLEIGDKANDGKSDITGGSKDLQGTQGSVGGIVGSITECRESTPSSTGGY